MLNLTLRRIQPPLFFQRGVGVKRHFLLTLFVLSKNASNLFSALPQEAFFANIIYSFKKYFKSLFGFASRGIFWNSCFINK